MRTEYVQQAVNARLYTHRDHVREFAGRVLRPVEVVILARYREALSGRVLEIGCGAGRLLGYLLALGGKVEGIDVSPRMIDYCREQYPGADVRVGDMTRLAEVVEPGFDCIFGSFNVLDVLPDAVRRQVLGDARDFLSPGGLMIFSSHNLAFVEQRTNAAARRPKQLLDKLNRPPATLIASVLRLPQRVRNRRRLAAYEVHRGDYAILNDQAFSYGLLHYYVRRDEQAAQLAKLGFELLECLDLEGRRVNPGGAGTGPELHYIARRR